MTVARIDAAERPAEAFEVRTVSNADLGAALRQGWADFLEHRGDLLFIGFIYPLVGFAAAAVALQDSLIPLFFPIAAGIGLMGPAAAAGFYELARRREAGLESDWSHFLDVARRPSFDAFLAVAGLLLLLFLAWLATAAGLYMALMGPAAPDSATGFLTRLFTTPEGWTLIVLGNLAGLAFSAAVLTVSVVAMPMLVDKDVDARTAIHTSRLAVAANKGAMLRWGVTVAALLVIGSIPFFVGLAVVLPVLGYATWHLYTRLVVR
ncbi:putative membrane protein [Sphingomonas naasensis]|uniref:DUF2189 domain-containing protein n=1 Tax=Sphingomonas naasensis TaxID=1344951 RepID=A0A4S1W4W6_9SPHN|nr:DUF2189 domain-containing protein [Sphingomonas naasensis]NIJ19942.1 putative membrane protein [Sphingomonas naasensis]TGX37901.1 DUF2189 domain-containing protein [Sphingomonas naasensis]